MLILLQLNAFHDHPRFAETLRGLGILELCKRVLRHCFGRSHEMNVAFQAILLLAVAFRDDDDILGEMVARDEYGPIQQVLRMFLEPFSGKKRCG